MALGCGGSCMKWLLIIFNVIFFLCGGALLGIGIWLLVDPRIQQNLHEIFPDGADPLFQASSIVITTVGAIIFVVGFFGCCGACKESSCMLATFAALLIIVLVIEIVGAILAGVFRNELGDTLKEQMDKTVLLVTKETKGDIPPTSTAWHAMQVNLDCCGSGDWRDYWNNTHFSDTDPVPKTCCVLNNNSPSDPVVRDVVECYREALRDTSQGATELHTTGCYDALEAWFREMSGIMIGVAVAIAVIQIIGIIFACCVRKELAGQGQYA